MKEAPSIHNGTEALLFHQFNHLLPLFLPQLIGDLVHFPCIPLVVGCHFPFIRIPGFCIAEGR